MPPLSCPDLCVNAICLITICEHLSGFIDNVLGECWVAQGTFNSLHWISESDCVYVVWIVIEDKCLSFPLSHMLWDRVNYLVKGLCIVE
jgi:hypothetical protein